MPIPAPGTPEFDLFQLRRVFADRKGIRAALRPAPADRAETVLTLWRTAMFDTVEIAARTGLREFVVDRIISRDMEERHG